MTPLQNQQLIYCIMMAYDHFKGDEYMVGLWMTTGNYLLGNSIPIYMIIVGRGHKVIQFMENARNENAQTKKT